jgi:RNA polymerase sigma-70 factor (ECF subfamily)
VVWVTREGGATLVDPGWDPQGTIDAMALSPDEKTLAVALSRNGKSDIWVKALPAGPFSRITFSDTGSTRPVWAPDGRSLLYILDRAGSGVGPVYEHRADGTGNASLVFRGNTDWGQIVGLYEVLLRIEPSPVVELNRAAAVAMRDGPAAGLALVDAILARGELGQYYLAHSARADLCRRLGRTDEARASYRRALELTRQEPERRFLEGRLRELTDERVSRG